MSQDVRPQRWEQITLEGTGNKDVTFEGCEVYEDPEIQVYVRPSGKLVAYVPRAMDDPFIYYSDFQEFAAQLGEKNPFVVSQVGCELGERYTEDLDALGV